MSIAALFPLLVSGGTVVPVSGIYTSVKNSGNTTLSNIEAVQYPTNWKEPNPSFGVNIAKFQSFVIEASSFTGGVVPKERDTFAVNSATHTVLSHQYVPKKAFYILDMVLVALASDLTDTCSIKQPSSQPHDRAGNREPVLATTYSGVACRFQELSSEEIEYMGKRVMERRYSVWFATDYNLTNENQIIRSNGQIHEVTGVFDRERLDALIRVETVYRGF